MRQVGTAPERARPGWGRPLGFSAPTAHCFSLAHMGAKVPNIPELANSPRFDLVVIEGLAEAMSPAILGFSILCLVWVIAAIGERRLRL
jgi:hypothetical protein